MLKEENKSAGNAPEEPWQACRTMRELGDQPRPSITKWLRHLACMPDDGDRGFNPDAAAMSMSMSW